MVVILLVFSAAVCFTTRFVHAEQSVFKTISTIASEQMIRQYGKDPGFVVLDVRTPFEFNGGHIDGAILIDFYSGTFIDKLKALDREKIYLIYCRSGNRSLKTLKIFSELGFSHAYNMERGIIGWQNKGFPLVR